MIKITGQNPLLLVMRLEGPLQSWGLESRWDMRDTGTEPSKSGIVGLIGCALGIPRFDPELEKLSTHLLMGVRTENAGAIIRDFQTITGKVLLANGKEKKENNTILSPKMYLEDASFLVVLQGDGNLLKKIAAALQSPHWQLYLGRKCCVPTRPLFETLTRDYASIDDAIARIPWEPRSYFPSHLFKAKDPRQNPPALLRCVLEDLSGKEIRYDEITSQPSRMYRVRRVKVKYVQNPGIASTQDGISSEVG
ncbi:type I-E CRISPR-associated protein Cas5/CasD [Candidatus Harpocratesius sp.]